MLRFNIKSAVCLVFICNSVICFSVKAQNNREDSLFIKKIYNQALEEQIAYKWLYYLSETIGHRIAGSPQNMAAIEFTHQILDSIGCTKVWKQPCTINYWYRGTPEVVEVINHPLVGTKKIHALALGNSAGTPEVGMSGDVIEVKTIEEVKKLGDALKGKIVFFNRAFHDADFHTFTSYGSCVDQRVFGPNAVAKFGAKACLVRSMTGRRDDVPHTGTSIFDEGVEAIPSLAISTRDADLLSQWLAVSPTLIYIKTNCEQRGPKQSYSVIGEIKGSVKPEEIIVVGGHLDSWDVGGGAHDDGAGCVHSMEVLHLFRKLGYQPKRTIRCVLFQNEENGLAGARTYAQVSNDNKEFHLAAIESDAGGFTPHGFSYDADSTVMVKYEKALMKWKELLSKFELKLQRGGSGADVGQLKSQKGLLLGLRPDSQRYFDYHHTEIDRIEAVHPRELALGSAAMASLVYLMDKYGLGD
jgi:hypothetical protein